MTHMNGNEDFEKLCKLLKIKRYEQPPPGYFNSFSDIVVNRLQREARTSRFEIPVLSSVLRLLETSPVFSGLFGAALCGLVIFGISSANQATQSPLAAFIPSFTGTAGADSSDALALNASVHGDLLGRTTDPMFGASSLVSPLSVGLQAQSVSFTPGQ